MRYVIRKDIEKRYNDALKKKNILLPKLEILRARIMKAQKEYDELKEKIWEYSERAAGANGLLHSSNWINDKLPVSGYS